MREVGFGEARDGGDTLEEGRHAAEADDLLIDQDPKEPLGREHRLHEQRTAQHSEVDQLHHPRRGRQRGDDDDAAALRQGRFFEREAGHIGQHGAVGEHHALGPGG